MKNPATKWSMGRWQKGNPYASTPARDAVEAARNESATRYVRIDVRPTDVIQRGTIRAIRKEVA